MKGLFRVLLLPLALLGVLHITLILSRELEFLQYLLASELAVATALLFYHRQQSSRGLGQGIRKRHALVVVPLLFIVFLGYGVSLERNGSTAWDRPIRAFISRQNDWIVASSMVGAAIISLIGLFIDRRNS